MLNFQQREVIKSSISKNDPLVIKSICQMIQIHSTQRSLTTIKTIEKRMILNKERSK